MGKSLIDLKNHQSKRINVMTVVDTLLIGGAENVAVMISNSLYSKGFQISFCCTRQAGPLRNKLTSDIPLYVLNKTSLFDWRANFALRKLIRKHQISILHVHNYSIFSAIFAKYFFPIISKVRIVWHDHSGTNMNRPFLPFLLASWCVDAIIVVDEKVKDLFRSYVKDKNKVHYLPNYIMNSETMNSPVIRAQPGLKIMNVGPIYKIKNQMLIIQALTHIVSEFPSVMLFLIGGIRDKVYYQKMLDYIHHNSLEKNVFFWGERNDVQDILKQGDLGVLSSRTEGTPLALLEYGLAGLPVVVTDVGECAHIVNNGLSGLVVPSQDVNSMAEAILTFLRSPKKRYQAGQALKQRVEQKYSEKTAIKNLIKIYLETTNKHAIF